MKKKTRWRVVVGGQATPMKTKKEAISFARYALKVGAMKACVERRKLYGGFDSVKCLTRR